MAEPNRGDIEIILASVDYPISRNALIDAAEEADVDETVILLFQDLPDREYEGPEEVNRKIEENQEKEGGKEQEAAARIKQDASRQAGSDQDEV